MARVKRGVTSHAKHKKLLEQAKGFSGRRHGDQRRAGDPAGAGGGQAVELTRLASRGVLA